jgi:hypothetical protein
MLRETEGEGEGKVYFILFASHLCLKGVLIVFLCSRIVNVFRAGMDSFSLSFSLQYLFWLVNFSLHRFVSNYIGMFIHQ